MELKPYQQQVINDLGLFLENIQETKDIKEAFYDFWAKHPKTPLFPFAGTAIEPYKNNVAQVPHICVKVPTAGGKTFIACNAIKTIFDAFAYDKPKAPPLTRESFRVVNVIKYQRDACTSLGNGEKCVTFNFFFRKNFYL
jgi:hypothetical protein